MVSMEKKSAILMSVGSFLVVTGAVMAVFWPSLFMLVLKKIMVLAPGSTSYNIWKEIPIPMYLEFFMFNISNVDDILAGKNVKMQVEQFGPYVFREYHKKVNITFNDNATVTFYNERTWFYEPEMSNGTLDDVITSINPIIATVAYVLRNQHPLLKVPVDVFMRMFHDNMFLTAPVRNWLFDGIEDPVLDVANHFPDLPINIPYDRFGWFYERNGSKEFDGIFLMNTGAKDFSSLGNVEKWKYSDRSNFRDECGVVQGSTGELWAPELGQQELTVFAPDICTYMNLARTDNPVEVLGVQGVEYAANNSLFDNGYRYPSKIMAILQISGEKKISKMYGVPLILFFVVGDLILMVLEGISNGGNLTYFLTDKTFLIFIKTVLSCFLSFLPSDMNFRLSLEMYTGMPLSVAAQLQINLLVRHVDAITINNQLPDRDTLVPMFWFRQELFMTEQYASLARLALGVRSGVPIGLYTITVAVGILLLVIGIFILLKKLLKPSDTLLDSPHEVVQ
ncbi:scavenger receptor class B member 3 [Danaus plexippus plexippus]|uniref:Scavenger receptor class B member 3 n=1 Tax=Danaus plexippus plexippus TaxID=278856 RepID=A0A212EWB0_DANPL|nr:scavenger receptor class B member 3 [Danaus plexippus plexippus]